mmetsp:Transcript_26777/g.89198  ORF Transcript_26777/g.89198 Transcript_26777/m.89198 type:complete len:262 (+) Transcript_26777:396-1181(+)
MERASLSCGLRSTSRSGRLCLSDWPSARPAGESLLPPSRKLDSSIAHPDATALQSTCTPASLSRLKARSSVSTAQREWCSAWMSGSRCESRSEQFARQTSRCASGSCLSPRSAASRAGGSLSSPSSSSPESDPAAGSAGFGCGGGCLAGTVETAMGLGRGTATAGVAFGRRVSATASASGLAFSARTSSCIRSIAASMQRLTAATPCLRMAVATPPLDLQVNSQSRSSSIVALTSGSFMEPLHASPPSPSLASHLSLTSRS